MRRKLDRSAVGTLTPQHLQKAGQMRRMAPKENPALLAGQRVVEPRWRIVRLKAADGLERRERIAGLPEDLRGLTRPQFPAVPHDRRYHAATDGRLRQASGLGASTLGQRPHRVEVWPDRLAVVDKIKCHDGILLRFVSAAISST